MKHGLSQSWLSFMVITALLFSFAFHTLWFDHDHPKFMGEGVQAIVHGQDKKWFLLLFLNIFLLWTGIGKSLVLDIKSHHTSFARVFKAFYFVSKLFDPLVRGFRRGIIHPKIYERALSGRV